MAKDKKLTKKQQAALVKQATADKGPQKLTIFARRSFQLGKLVLDQGETVAEVTLEKGCTLNFLVDGIRGGHLSEHDPAV